MTSKGIAQRLLTTYGPSTAKAKVQDKLRQLSHTRTHGTRTLAAKATVRQMLWVAVRHHLEQA